ncbi:MAG: amidohydrolase family protein [Candidatus Thorarchaeota archaeon]
MVTEHDILIRNATIIDGTGGNRYKGDIGIREGIITSVGKRIKADSKLTINAKGLVCSPGFIDIHSHNDTSMLFDNRLQSMVHQGVTTSVIGNCGFSLAPITDDRIELMDQEIKTFLPPGQKLTPTWRTFEEYLAKLETIDLAMNIIALVGFGTVRIAGGPAYEDRPPNSEEMLSMRMLVEEAMQAGAFGMSTGLIYAPQIYAETEEILELAKVVAHYDGLYFSHIRGEGETLVDAVNEAVDIVERSGCRGGQIAHHKVAGRAFWGLSKKTLRIIAEANERGQQIACDQYPYNRGATSLITVLPPWAHEGGLEAALERLRDSATRLQIISDIESGLNGWENIINEASWDGVYISYVKTDKWAGIEGLSLSAIAESRGYEVPFDMLFDLLLDEKGEVSMTIESMGEEDIRRIMQSSYTMIGTDGSGVAPTGVMSSGKPHPRHYGTYPRILGKYVREEGVLSFEEAIWKMSGFPAKQLGLLDRGFIREGIAADIVVFDPETVIDKSTFLDPHHFPEGIHHVITNGVSVIRNRQQTEYLPGVILKHGEGRPFPISYASDSNPPS